jgi:hypothetical protein
MELMIRGLLGFILVLPLCFSGAAFAQDQEAARREAERAARKEMATDNRAIVEAAHGGAERYREMLLRVEYEDLRQALRGYQAAREELAVALSFKTKLKEHARKIDKSAGVFVDFIKRRIEKRHRFEPTEFKDFTASELNWEALTTTERLAPDLAAVIQSQNASSVEVGFLLSLSKLEAELLRLKWMLGKLK